jgi:hypothetical protein
MKHIIAFEQPPIKTGCSYGDSERANTAPLQLQCFSVVFGVAVASILFCNFNLHRFYKPLARIVDLSFLCKAISFCLYFMYYPYAEGEGNCGEIFFGRSYKALIMIGEMHQIYLIAHVLGIARQNLFFVPTWMSLETLLNVLSVLVVVTIFLTYELKDVYVRPFRHLWSGVVSLIQLRIISYARTLPSNRKEYDVISTSDSSILLFEKLSVMQLFPCAFLFVRRVLFLYGVIIFPPADKLEGVVLIMDETIVLLFYIKVIMVTLKANLEIGYVV